MFKVILKTNQYRQLFIEYRNTEYILNSEDPVEIREELNENEVLKIYCKETTENDIKKLIHLLPIKFLSTIVSVILLDDEKWTEHIEPYYFSAIYNITGENSKNELVIEYLFSQYDDVQKEFTEPKIVVDGQECECKYFANPKNLKKCFLEWIIRVFIIILYCEIFFLAIVISSPHVFPYWHSMFFIMILLLIAFGYLFYRENRRFRDMVILLNKTKNGRKMINVR